MTTNQDLIGRDDVNDLEAILAVTNTDVDAVVHSVNSNLDAVFTWCAEWESQLYADHGCARPSR